MSAQDLEQRARELLPELPPMAMTVAGDDPDAGHWYRAEQMRDYAASAIVTALRQQPAPVDLDFAEWIAKELPAGTVIGDPAWWANRIARQYAKRTRQPAPVADDAMRELIEQRDTLLNALKHALPHVEHAYHTHEDLDGSFWADVVGCRNALARVQGVQS